MGFGQWLARIVGADTLDRLMREGHAFLSSGEYDKARQCYRRILAGQPEHAEAHFLLGAASEAMGDLAEAARSYERAVELAPEHAEAHNNLGCLLEARGDARRAEAAYREALRCNPALAQAHYNLGNILGLRGRLDEALECYRSALALQPERAQVHYGLGKALRSKGDLEGAIESFQQALELDPEIFEAARDLGIVWFERGDAEQADIFTSRALQLDPDSVEMHIHLGNIHRHRGRFDDALASLLNAVALAPGMAQAHNNLGSGYLDLGRPQEAAAAFRKAIALDRNLAEAHLNLGIALQRGGEDAQAMVHYRTALEVKPDFAEAFLNLGGLLEHEGDPAGALDCYARAVAIKPDFAQAHFNHSLQLLLVGRFAQGWEEYEWRWKLPDMGLGGVRPHADKPYWDGSALEGKTLLLFTEQGFGDAIQFLRYAPMAEARGGKVILKCLPEQEALFRRTAGISLVATGGEPLPEFDLCCSLLSLPRLFNTTLETIPAPVPYVHADPEDARRWRARLDPEAAARRVGLVWATQSASGTARARTLELEAFAPLAAVPGIVFCSLQKGPAAAQAARPPRGMRILDAGGELKDFADTAALMTNLDLVISIDTAAAHLAGALGRPVWMLANLPPEWRWLLGREDSPWYPTMRLFRRRQGEDWPAVIARIALALPQFVRSAGNRQGG